MMFHAMMDAPVMGLPDYLTGRASASATVSCTLDVTATTQAQAILIDPSEAPVYAVEIYPRALAMTGT